MAAFAVKGRCYKTKYARHVQNIQHHLLMEHAYVISIDGSTKIYLGVFARMGTI